MNHADLGRYGKRVIQLFWDPEPKNDDTSKSPIWCLGHRYETIVSNLKVDNETTLDSQHGSVKRPELQSRPLSSSHTVTTVGSFEKVDLRIDDTQSGDYEAILSSDVDWPKAFLDDFESQIHFTYRSNFPPIPRSLNPKATASMSLSVRLKSQTVHHGGFTSDTGWGCMIRSGQSVLANALAMSRSRSDRELTTITAQDKKILNWFADDPRAPFSIHRFVAHGAAACGTFPGQWFGPSATAKCIQALTNNFHAADLKVYVTGDGPDVFEDQLYRIATSENGHFTPTLLLVGTRLGIDRVTPVYWDALKESLQMVQSVGIAGGRPSSSHYFVGTQGSNFFYLDPHQTQPALPYAENPENITAEHINSCHTRRLRRMPIEELDPSMLIAFLFRDKSDWSAWRKSVNETSGKAIFHVADSTPAEYSASDEDSAINEVETLEDDFSENEVLI